jgi:predicted ABC-type ATPase
MDIQKLSNEIATLKRAVKEAATAPLKEKLRKKIALLDQNIKDANIPAKKLAMMLLGAKRKVAAYTQAEFNAVIKRLSNKAEYSFLKGLSKGEIKDDLERHAKNPGWRFKGRSNFKTPTRKDLAADAGLSYSRRKTYYENRSNRSDVTNPAKLKDGGGIEFGNLRNANANITKKQIKDKIEKRTKLEKLIEAKRKGSKKTVALGGIQVSLDTAIDYYKKLRYATGGGVGDDQLNVVFSRQDVFEKAKDFYENESAFYPTDVNDEFRTFVFDIENGEADVTEYYMEQELQDTDLDGYYFEIADKMGRGGSVEDKIKDLEQKRKQLLIDMEEEAEPEGGPIANRYGRLLNSIEKKIRVLKYGKRELTYEEVVANRSNRMKHGGNLTANDVSRGSWVKHNTTKVLAKVWNVDPTINMMQLEDIYGNKDMKFRYMKDWSLVNTPTKKLKEIKEEFAQMGTGGGVGIKEGEDYLYGRVVGKNYTYTNNKIPNFSLKVGIFKEGKSPNNHYAYLSVPNNVDASILTNLLNKSGSINNSNNSYSNQFSRYDLSEDEVKTIINHFTKISGTKKMGHGGLAESENKEMVLNNAQQIEHHAEELENATKKSKHVPAWVVAKIYNASSNISDATHYLEGVNTMPKEHFERIHEEVENHKMETGGGIDSFLNKQMHISKVCKTHGCSTKDYFNAKNKYIQIGNLNDLLKKKVKGGAVGDSCEIFDSKGERAIDNDSIEKLTKCVTALPQTKSDNVNANGTYTSERQELHKKIINKFKKDVVCITKGKPIAVLMGGSPASGKSTFLKKYRPYLLSESLFKVDADEIRAELPEYKGWNATQTHEEAGDIVNTLISDKNIGVPCNFDFIFDGTMSSVKRYNILIHNLRKENYQIYIVFMSNISKEEVKRRALERYKHSGRFVPMFVIDEFYANGEKNLNELKSMVDGYIVVDASSPNYTIIEQGGKKLPNKRLYEKLGEKIKLKKGGPTGQEKVGIVMHEFKEGTLHSGKNGKIVKNPKQAIAIALSEAGLSKNKGWKHKK